MRILSYPNKILPGHKLSFILKNLGIESTDYPEDKHITHIIHSDYRNVSYLKTSIISLSMKIGKNIINQRCLNVRKDFVENRFSSVFGYGSIVNPTTHVGTCVVKSTQQAVHNGKLIQCPIPDKDVDNNIYYSKSGEPHVRIYQKLIDTRFEIDKIRDIRVPVIADEIPCVFVKELGVGSTFHPYKENYYKVYMDEASNWFSDQEIEKILLFAKLSGIDFGEMDILRDNSTSLIYIIDVNNIPMGTLFKHLKNKQEAINRLSNSFKKLL